MLYDVRMGPQAVCHRDVIYIVYQGGEDGPEGHPHITAYDLDTGAWRPPQRLGTVPRYDHHLAPVLWLDAREHLHVLYDCHGQSGTHIVSSAPRDTSAWRTAPKIAPSISYPRIVGLPEGRRLLYYRCFGHMGYWGYRISDDGGYTWSENHRLTDFDQNPASDADTWAGSYHSIAPSADGTGLHIAFVYWDERGRPNPLYGRRMGNQNRYNLYYAHLDLASHRLDTVEGDRLDTPLTRRSAEACKILDTGHCVSNMPAIADDARDGLRLLAPLAGEEDAWHGQFRLVKPERSGWSCTPVCTMNNTWDGCLLGPVDDGVQTAYIVSGDHRGETCMYGGGTVEVWRSGGAGGNWERVGELVPEPGLLYNNPKPVERSTGGEMRGYLALYGWEGPGGIQVTGASASAVSHLHQGPVPQGNRGRAYLWNEGTWL